MAIIDDLIESWLERNSVTLSGSATIALQNGGIKIRTEIASVIRDTRRNKAIATMVIPVVVSVKIPDVTIPVRIPSQNSND